LHSKKQSKVQKETMRNLNNKGVLLLLLLAYLKASKGYYLISAINSGGVEHYSNDGISFVADTNYTGGSTSMWESALNIGSVKEQDRILYRSFRYSESAFSYNIPVAGDGKYVLTLKFAAYKNSVINDHIFNVSLNSAFTILGNVNLFEKFGNVARDEFIHFDVCDNGKTLVYGDHGTRIENGMISVTFVPVKSAATIDALMLLKSHTAGETIILLSSPTPAIFKMPTSDNCGYISMLEPTSVPTASTPQSSTWSESFSTTEVSSSTTTPSSPGQEASTPYGLQQYLLSFFNSTINVYIYNYMTEPRSIMD
jgi:Malectin domain